MRVAILFKDDGNGKSGYNRNISCDKYILDDHGIKIIIKDRMALFIPYHNIISFAELE